jgi:hypothetical protein
MLTDWITQLQKARVEAIEAIGSPEEQRRLGYFIHDNRLPPHCYGTSNGEARSH